MSEATVSEATMPEATVPEATVPEATVAEATVAEMTMPEGVWAVGPSVPSGVGIRFLLREHLEGDSEVRRA